jgi:hypothetical protein
MVGWGGGVMKSGRRQMGKQMGKHAKNPNESAYRAESPPKAQASSDNQDKPRPEKMKKKRLFRP